MNVKVLGSGCKSCHKLYENALQAVKVVGGNINVEYITDIKKVIEYGAMSMPALVIDDMVVSEGRVLKSEEITKLIIS